MNQQQPISAGLEGHGAQAVGTAGVGINGDSHGHINTGTHLQADSGAVVVYAEQGATVVIGDAPVAMPAVDRESALGRYLQHLISQNRYLQLQGIRSGGKPVNIELDRIYITLRATRHRARRADLDWLAEESALAPGERHRALAEAAADIGHVTVNAALTEHTRLVVLGDPGIGKTTLLRYLTLLYARDLAEDTDRVRSELGLPERGVLPIFLPLRQMGRYLAEHRRADDGLDGHGLLLDFLEAMLDSERIEVPADFFDAALRTGQAAILLDGLDEVADPALRRRVSRLVDGFTRAHPGCRMVVTSRIVGYTEASQLTEGYAAATVRDFSLDDIRRFLSQWHRLVAIGQMGPGPTAEAHAAEQTRQLLDAIEGKDRVRELAINPLMLTVIALVHRDSVKLPDQRAELYAEAVDVLLGKWDDARGVPDSVILAERGFDRRNRRLILQDLALAMHERKLKEIDAEPLGKLLTRELADDVDNPRELPGAVERFLQVIRERTGLLIARGEGTYAFSHLTFQEYLAALAIAGRDDYVDYTLARSGEEWWREVILLEAGHLSTQSRERTTRLIQAIADWKPEPEPYHNLVLAAEALRDAGANRITGNLEKELRARLQRELDAPPVGEGFFGGMRSLLTRGLTPAAAAQRRIAAAEALGKIGGQRYWTLPWGEPDWVLIPAGEFTMGDGSEAHRVDLPEFRISRVPITQAQYQIFVQATDHPPPPDWTGKRAPKGKESHPVTRVSWHDALAYCRWLCEATGRSIALPSEAEWEKAARGMDDARAYPWGDAFDAAKCNTRESGFDGTSPVGIFAQGASPFGCLDMAGNVWEWTRSLWGEDGYKPSFDYPYDPTDAARENLDAGGEILRLVRGGAWGSHRGDARCAFRGRLQPVNRYGNLGFRVVLISAPVRLPGPR